MNIEFIIGTILGLIGAIPIIWQWQQKLRKADMSELMNRLVDKNRTPKQHKKVLNAINWKLLREGKHLKKEYIDNFVLGKRGKEAVFEDLCLQNRLEPTPELCRQFLKTDSPAIRDRYYRRLADEKSAATGAKPGPQRRHPMLPPQPQAMPHPPLGRLLKRNRPHPRLLRPLRASPKLRALPLL